MLLLVRPETLLRWHRRPVAGAGTSSHRATGRPPPDQQLQQLILRMARENPRWSFQGTVALRPRASSNLSGVEVLPCIEAY
jgi:hypothetical protein